MSSTNKTAFLGLNQWVGVDKPKRDDFNRDNQYVDTKMRSHCEDMTAHVTVQERDAWNKSMFTIGTYTGNGATPTRTISLGYQPRMVFIYAAGRALVEYRATTDSNSIYSAMYTPYGASFGLEITPMGFTVRNSTSTVTGGNTLAMNQSGVVYAYVVFR